MTTSFPAGFLWGAATSAYQIEGSPLADGAAPNIWHRFSHTPGRTVNGDTGDVACEHYAHPERDVAIMRDLGLASYRFSIAWARVMPDGTGRVNAKGLAFYDRLVDLLLAAGITPNATLYHWDLPAALDDRGGWLNRDVADWFADYARVCFGALDDRVPLWSTLNEPWVVSEEGYLRGTHAPGHASPYEAPIASHNLLRAHAEAVRAYRADGTHHIGLVVNLEPKYPASQSPDDLDATRRDDAYFNRQFLDPVFLGRYPRELREIYGDAWPDWPADDVQRIAEPIDFLGVNYYLRKVARYDASAWPVFSASVPQPKHPRTEIGWEVYAPGLTRTLLMVKERYGDIPLYVTENGAAFYDPPHAVDGSVDDPMRVWYLREHLRAARDAIAQGVDLRGYYAWSLLDNFEWRYGYTKRFGIVHVNYDTQERTPKTSARFYSDVIRSNGSILGG